MVGVHRHSVNGQDYAYDRKYKRETHLEIPSKKIPLAAMGFGYEPLV
jgi:hypothetical protein